MAIRPPPEVPTAPSNLPVGAIIDRPQPHHRTPQRGNGFFAPLRMTEERGGLSSFLCHCERQRRVAIRIPLLQGNGFPRTLRVLGMTEESHPHSPAIGRIAPQAVAIRILRIPHRTIHRTRRGDHRSPATGHQFTPIPSLEPVGATLCARDRSLAAPTFRPHPQKQKGSGLPAAPKFLNISGSTVSPLLPV